MSTLIANLLEQNVAEFATRWAATRLPIEGDAGADDRDRESFYLSIYQLLIVAMRSGDYQSLLNQLYQEGVSLAVSGVKVSWVVARMLAASRILRDLTLAALKPRQRTEAAGLLDQLAERSLSAMMEGYTAGEHRYIAAQETALSELNLRTRDLVSNADHRLLARVAQLGALHRINAAANSNRDLDSLLRFTVDEITDVLYVDVCSVFIHEAGDWLALRATHGLSPDSVGMAVLRLGEGVTGRAAIEGKPIAIRDAWNDPSFKYVPGIGEEAFSSILAVPILLFAAGNRPSQLVGVFTIQTRDFRDFTEDEIKFLETLSGEIAIAIENYRLAQATDERLRSKLNELNTIQWVSQLIVGNTDLGYILDLIVRQALPLTQADVAAVFEFEAATNLPRIVASQGLSDEYISRIGMPVGWRQLADTVREGRELYIGNVYDWLWHTEAMPDGVMREIIEREGFASMLCVPLATARKVLGGICIYTRHPYQFTEEQKELFRTFTELAALAIENARLYDDLRRSLATKSLLLRELQHRVRNNLQAVAALLSMQQRRMQGAASTALSESVARIQSIAAVHDLLSREEIGQTSIASLAHEIFEVVRAGMSAPEMNIEFIAEGHNIYVRDKEATWLALILTELFSNAALHGFSLDRLKVGGQPQTDCLIKVTAARDPADPTLIRVTVSDNGRGLSPDFDLAANADLGLQIVQTLTERDLGGKFRIGPAPLGGTAAIVEFCT